jgi:hypothetical protein
MHHRGDGLSHMARDGHGQVTSPPALKTKVQLPDVMQCNQNGQAVASRFVDIAATTQAGQSPSPGFKAEQHFGAGGHIRTVVDERMPRDHTRALSIELSPEGSRRSVHLQCLADLVPEMNTATL